VLAQVLPARDPAAAPFAAMCAAHAVRAGADHRPVSGSGPFPHAKACGYCGLLAHHPPLAGAGFAVPLLRSTCRSEAAARVFVFRPTPQFCQGRPRGPPQRVS